MSRPRSSSAARSALSGRSRVSDSRRGFHEHLIRADRGVKGHLWTAPLRHSCASALTTGGLAATTLARITGHSDPGFTYRVYARDARDDAAVVADVLGRAERGVRRVSQHLVSIGGRLVAFRGRSKELANVNPCGSDAHWRFRAPRGLSLPCRRSWVRVPSSALPRFGWKRRDRASLGPASRSGSRVDWHGRA
jgi:hypothetical protein